MAPRMVCSLVTAAIAAVSLLTATKIAIAAIAVTEAKIENGRLTVKGTGPAGTYVKLDSLAAVPINARTREWAYDIVYHPGDCIVELKLIGATAPEVKAVVALCGPRGLRPRGAWSATVKIFRE